jgi:hypothetical protein
VNRPEPPSASTPDRREQATTIRPIASKAATLRRYLREARPLVSPGVYDCYRAKLV